ncbi:MAG: hypothetical protein HUU37_03270 [Bdellovibrionales bacterium]|nr:hypothetical protein [Bdellovibrionales bacterium]
MSTKYLKIPASRFEADRRLIREVFIFLPLNDRHVRLRQKGQYFERAILENYRNKGYAEFLIDATNLTDPNPMTVDLFETGYEGEGNVVEFQPGQEEATVLPFSRKNAVESGGNPSAQEVKPENEPRTEPQTERQEAREEPLGTESEGSQPAQELSEHEPPRQEGEAPVAVGQPVPLEESDDPLGIRAIQKRGRARETEGGDDAPVTLEQKTRKAQKSRDEAERIREEKKKYFAEKMRLVREQQEKEKAEREEKKRIRRAKEAEEAVERFDRGADEALDKLRFGAETAEDEAERSFSGKNESELSRVVSGQDDREIPEERRIHSSASIPKESRFLSSTKELDDAVDKLKESFIKGRMQGKDDDIVLDLANIDPEVDRLLESAIASNEIGKKMVLLGIQLESVSDREREKKVITQEDRRANEQFRRRIVDRIEFLGKTLETVKAGVPLKGELRSELNIDLHKEEIVDAIRAGKNGLEKIVALTQSVEGVKEGLVKTESLILQKEVARLVAEADPEKGKDFVRVIKSGSTEYEQNQPEEVVRAFRESEATAREGLMKMLKSDGEFESASKEMSKRLANSYVNEISAYTAQLAMALGYSHHGFLRELVMASLLCNSADDSAAKLHEAPPAFTRLLLEKFRSRADLDSVVYDAIQIIELVKRIVENESFRSGTGRLEPALSDAALTEASKDTNLFLTTFLERSRQYIGRGIKLSDASYSYQLSREAILALKAAAVSQ